MDIDADFPQLSIIARCCELDARFTCEVCGLTTNTNFEEPFPFDPKSIAAEKAYDAGWRILCKDRWILCCPVCTIRIKESGWIEISLNDEEAFEKEKLKRHYDKEEILRESKRLITRILSF